MIDNWGTAADLRDHSHPFYAATSCDPTSPPISFAEAQLALSEACWRYEVATGECGLSLARRIIEPRYGAPIADYVLGRLANRTVEQELDDLLAGPFLEPGAPPADPTSAERRAAALEVAHRALSYPEMGDLRDRLETFQAVLEADGDMGGAASTAALAALTAALEGAHARGADPELMQVALDSWSAGTGGPKIAVSVQRS